MIEFGSKGISWDTEEYYHFLNNLSQWKDFWDDYISLIVSRKLFNTFQKRIHTDLYHEIFKIAIETKCISDRFRFCFQ